MMKLPDKYVRIQFISGNNVIVDENTAEILVTDYLDAGQDRPPNDVLASITDIHGNEVTIRTGFIQLIKYTSEESRKAERRFYVAENGIERDNR